MKNINIITHNSTFHADEVSATAMLKIVYKNVSIFRVQHQTPIEDLVRLQGENGFIIDIGRQFDPNKRIFDHHQWSKNESDRSSAGLILDYIIAHTSEDGDVWERALRPIISRIDAGDIGAIEPAPDSISNIISMMNADDVNSETQVIAFRNAVSLAENVFKNALKMGKKIQEAKNKFLEEAVPSTEIKSVLEFQKEYIPFWDEVIHELDKFNEMDIVIWYDESQDVWKAQTVPLEPGSFQPRKRLIRHKEILPKNVVFVHKGEFFIVASDKEALVEYLKENLYIPE